MVTYAEQTGVWRTWWQVKQWMVLCSEDSGANDWEARLEWWKREQGMTSEVSSLNAWMEADLITYDGGRAQERVNVLEEK
jgi:hypothetical protein